MNTTQSTPWSIPVPRLGAQPGSAEYQLKPRTTAWIRATQNDCRWLSEKETVLVVAAEILWLFYMGLLDWYRSQEGRVREAVNRRILPSFYFCDGSPMLGQKVLWPMAYRKRKAVACLYLHWWHVWDLEKMCKFFMVFSRRGEEQSWENPFLMISGISDVFTKYCPCKLRGVLKGDWSLQTLWVKPQFSPEAMW